MKNHFMTRATVPFLLLLLVIPPVGAATTLRLASPNVIELIVVGAELTSTGGLTLTVPTTATAVSLNVTAVDPSSSGFITVWPCGVDRPLASNLNYVAGDVVPNGVIAPIGERGSVCFYSLADTDVVVDIAGWFSGTSFTGATPQRLIDTRNGTGSPRARITPETPLSIQVTNIQVNTSVGVATTIPADVTAVALNITVVNPSLSGFLTVWPCDVERPLASNVNFSANDIVANGVVAPVSINGTVCVYSQVATDVVIDLAGWFPGNSFIPTTPKRLVDTRDGTGGQTGHITPANIIEVPIRGQSFAVGDEMRQVPDSATAAALNVTVVSPLGSGFATVWPCGVDRPLASNLNFVKSQIVANNVIAPIGANGSVCLFSNKAAHMIVDISGWFLTNSGNDFIGTTPSRFIDTRTAIGPGPILDTDGDGISNEIDDDDDNDGIPDIVDPTPLGATQSPIADEEMGGVWFGTSTNDQGGPNIDMFAFSTDDGRIAAVSLTTGAQFIGNASVTGDQLTGTVTGVAPAGFVWLNGNSFTALSFSGQLSERTAISALWKSPSTNESGTLNLQYDSIHTRPSSSGKFQGTWVTIENIQLGTSGELLHVGLIDANFTLANGDFIGEDVAGCKFNGTIKPVDSQFNVYDVNVTVSSCIIGSDNLNGQYIGLGVLTDTSNLNGSINTDAGFIFAVNNGSFYLTDVLFRNN